MTWFKKIFSLLALVLVSSLAYAQVQTNEERHAAGNVASAGAGARIDLTNERLGRFISGQEALLNQTNQNITNYNITFTTRIGAMTTALGQVSNANGCDPDAGPHGCSCACAGPDEKMLWTGSAWQCYRAQCPEGQNFDPATCQCKPCSSCGQCPVGQIAVPTGGLNGCGEPAGTCVCESSYRRPAQGFSPQLEPWLTGYQLDESQCPIASTVTCRDGMDFRANHRQCCCPAGQRLANGQCGDVCPTGYLPHIAGTNLIDYCFRNNYHTVNTMEECSGAVVGNTAATCGGGNALCCAVEAGRTNPTIYGESTTSCVP